MSSLCYFRQFLIRTRHKAVNRNSMCVLRTWPSVSRLFSSQIYDPDDSTPPLPQYSDRQRKNEAADVRRARLLYQSRKRGIAENGLLLSTFADRYLDSMTEEQMGLYDTLINKPENDWDIYYWAIGNKPTPSEYDNDVMSLLKEHAQNKDLENRTRQPDLKP